MKLQSAGFAIDETTLFSSDDHCERVGIMKNCKNHISPNSNDIVYIGDAEWDFEAATKLQWGFIGIGERLKGKTELWIEDYTSEYWKSAFNKVLGRQLRSIPTDGLFTTEKKYPNKIY